MADTNKSNLPSSYSSMWPTSGLFDDFRKEMDSLVNGFFGSDRQMPARSRLLSNLPAGLVNPAIDVSENDDAIILTAELPGMVEDDVDLTIREGVLTLKGEKKHERDEEKDSVHVSERSYGSFQRVMPIPDRVDSEKITAKFDKGVLVVTMPKKPESVAAARKVSIEK